MSLIEYVPDQVNNHNKDRNWLGLGLVLGPPGSYWYRKRQSQFEGDSDGGDNH